MTLRKSLKVIRKWPIAFKCHLTKSTLMHFHFKAHTLLIQFCYMYTTTRQNDHHFHKKRIHFKMMFRGETSQQVPEKGPYQKILAWT